MMRVFLSLFVIAFAAKVESQNNILPVITFDMNEFMAHQQMQAREHQRQMPMAILPPAHQMPMVLPPPEHPMHRQMHEEHQRQMHEQMHRQMMEEESHRRMQAEDHLNQMMAAEEHQRQMEAAQHQHQPMGPGARDGEVDEPMVGSPFGLNPLDPLGLRNPFGLFAPLRRNPFRSSSFNTGNIGGLGGLNYFNSHLLAASNPNAEEPQVGAPHEVGAPIPFGMEQIPPQHHQMEQHLAQFPPQQQQMEPQVGAPNPNKDFWKGWIWFANDNGDSQLGGPREEQPLIVQPTQFQDPPMPVGPPAPQQFNMQQLTSTADERAEDRHWWGKGYGKGYDKGYDE